MNRGFALVMLLCMSIAAWPIPEYRLAVWPEHAHHPDFKLVSADGGTRELRDYRGYVVVLFFGFVHCPDVCPAELFKLKLALQQMGPLAKRLQVLFVTLDPERDTPSVLKNYVSAFDPRMLALTGTTAQVDLAAEAFGVQYARVVDGADYTIDHSTSTFVIDAAGRLRLVGSMSSTVPDLVHDLSALARE